MERSPTQYFVGPVNQAPIVLARDIGLISATTAVCVAAAWGWDPSVRYAAIAIATLLALWRWTTWRSSLVHVTDQRIFLQNGRVLRVQPVESITTVVTRQTLLGHVFNYGTLFIDTGGGLIVLNNLADPFEVAMNIEILRDVATGSPPPAVATEEILEYEASREPRPRPGMRAGTRRGR